MHSLAKDDQCFLVDLLPPPPPIPKAIQIQCDDGDRRLPLSVAIAEYHMAKPKSKITILVRRYSIVQEKLR